MLMETPVKIIPDMPMMTNSAKIKVYRVMKHSDMNDPVKVMKDMENHELFIDFDFVRACPRYWPM